MQPVKTVEIFRARDAVKAFPDNNYDTAMLLYTRDHVLSVACAGEDYWIDVWRIRVDPPCFVMYTAYSCKAVFSLADVTHYWHQYEVRPIQNTLKLFQLQPVLAEDPTYTRLDWGHRLISLEWRVDLMNLPEKGE